MSARWPTQQPTGVMVLADGTALYGHGLGAIGQTIGEVCFNTAITGYQEILTDPSYANQIVTFTFPHIGNVGTNGEDDETSNPASGAACGVIIREPITAPANYRSDQHLDRWLVEQGIIGLSEVDTRAITNRIRTEGMFNAAIAHDPNGNFDLDALSQSVRDFAGLEGADLAAQVSRADPLDWSTGRWHWEHGFSEGAGKKHVVAIDFGAKQNILRCLVEAGCKVTLLPANTDVGAAMKLDADGYFLSNGPGDPAATAQNVMPLIEAILNTGKPVFGICLGHQLLGLALGAKTVKMAQGHHGANHPVQEIATGKVEITSMNHGFAIDRSSLPEQIVETHVSLFDGTNCGIRHTERPIFSVQHHPEASPGPQDSHYLFDRFVAEMER